jgi:hypothetical protein
MQKRSVLLAPVLAIALGGSPALADTAKTVTATGSAETAVKPADRKSDASIRAAVDAAKKAGIAGALKEAHEYALLYAGATGLTLGSIVSVSDAQSGLNSTFGPYGGPFFGPFGPGHYCGSVPQPVFKTVNHKRKLVRVKRVRRCFVPAFQETALTVTYSAT